MTSNDKDTQLFDGVVIFTHVVNCGSFTAAAEITGHSTSYISKEINKLEARLALRLLNRTTRTLSLTPEGKVYYEQCQQLVLDAQDALTLLSQSHVSPKGKFKISCPVAFSQGYLQNIILEYMRLYPEVQLELELNDRQVDLVQDAFDLVIRATGQLEESSLICKKIYTSKGLVVASKEYIERYGKPTHPSELAEHACLCYSNLKNPYRWQFTSLDKSPFFVDVKCKVLCNSAHMELAMVIAGEGICRLPEFVMEQELKEGKLEVLFNDYLAPEINVYAIYPSRKHLSPKVRCFIDLLEEHIPVS